MKFLAFGDSFVKMFIHCKHQVRFRRFKGKSIRGLIKQGSKQRKDIQDQIKRTSKYVKIMFFFGQVDYNYVRYYKVIKGQPPIDQQTFKKYVQWISSMNINKNITIINIFPSPVKKQFIIQSFFGKQQQLQQQRTEEIQNKILDQYDNSNQTWYQWNGWIQKHCKLNKFLDLSDLAIHLRYVPVLEQVKKHFNITFDAQKAQKVEKDYQADKTVRIKNAINYQIQKQQLKKQQLLKKQQQQQLMKKQIEKQNQKNIVDQQQTCQNVQVQKKKKKKKNKNKTKKYEPPKQLKVIKTKLDSSQSQQDQRKFDPDSDSQDQQGNMFLQMAKNKKK